MPLTAALARCDRELAEIDAQLHGGAGDVEGLLQGLQDWCQEKRLIEQELTNGIHETL